jgi:hypothetical protein
MNTENDADAGVHRLVDMVVEEVSLVDRAANKHRFLVVKRREPMADEETKEPAPKDGAPEDAPPPPKKKKPTKKADADVLSIATDALDTLTTAVERLGEADGEATQSIAEELVGELAEVAAALAEAAGLDTDDDEETENSEGLTATIGEVRGLLAKVTAALATAKHAAEAIDPTADTERSPAPPPTSADRVTSELAAVAATLRTLTDAMKEQGQRLGRLEKNIALPNSRSAPERPERRPEAQEVGWPLDLNRPLDRESVDKSLSFHDR